MLTFICRVLVPAAIIGVLFASLPVTLHGQQSRRLAEAQLFFELNDTDGDLGIHASIDGEAWTDLVILGPHGGRDDISVRRDDNGQLLTIVSRGTLRRQGLTQLSFESAEPSFDELLPETFFARFPEGRYEVVANALEGGQLTGSARLSHVMAAPPENIRLNGVPAAESCEEPLPTVVGPVMVDWDAVRQSHPDIGKRGAIKVDRYQLFVEHEAVTMSVDLEPGVTEFEVPLAITRFGGVFKLEIIVRTDTGNNTAIESCFLVHP